MNTKAYKQYRAVGLQSEILSADPHRLVQLMFEGILEALAEAKVNIQNNKVVEKSKAINKACRIIIGLKASLNFENKHIIGYQLDRLYDFMNRHLIRANSKSSIQNIDEVRNLVLTIKQGWDGISEDVRKEFYQKQKEKQANGR